MVEQVRFAAMLMVSQWSVRVSIAQYGRVPFGFDEGRHLNRSTDSEKNIAETTPQHRVCQHMSPLPPPHAHQKLAV